MEDPTQPNPSAPAFNPNTPPQVARLPDGRYMPQTPGIPAPAGAALPDLPPPVFVDRTERAPTILDLADEATRGDRQRDYGHPSDNHGRTAMLWTHYLGIPDLPGVQFAPNPIGGPMGAGLPPSPANIGPSAPTREDAARVRAETAPPAPAEPVNERARHPAVAHVLQYFQFAHLPPHLQDVSRPFHALALDVARRAEASPETTVALRKLLEAKDAAVRAALPTTLPNRARP